MDLSTTLLGIRHYSGKICPQFIDAAIWINIYVLHLNVRICQQYSNATKMICIGMGNNYGIYFSDLPLFQKTAKGSTPSSIYNKNTPQCLHNSRIAVPYV